MELRNLGNAVTTTREDEQLLLNRPILPAAPAERPLLSTILDSVFNFTNSIVGAGD